MNAKTLGLGIVAVFALVLMSMSAEAYYPQEPYTGINTIGTVWQAHGLTAGYVQPFVSHRYVYPFVAREGGSFNIGGLTGLRKGVNLYVPQTHYSQYIGNHCTWPNCYLGASGYRLSGYGSRQTPVTPRVTY